MLHIFPNYFSPLTWENNTLVLCCRPIRLRLMWKFKYCGLQAKILSGKTKVTVLIGVFIDEFKPPELDQIASFTQAKGKFLEPEQGNSIRCSALPFAIFSLCQASNVSRCNVWLKFKLRGDLLRNKFHFIWSGWLCRSGRQCGPRERVGNCISLFTTADKWFSAKLFSDFFVSFASSPLIKWTRSPVISPTEDQLSRCKLRWNIELHFQIYSWDMTWLMCRRSEESLSEEATN